MMERPNQVTWEDLAELEDANALAELSPDDAFAVLSDVVNRPMVGGIPLELDAVDADSIRREFTSRYVNATFGQDLQRALAAGESVRSVTEEDTVPALCRASGVPRDAYTVASAWRDEGDPSLMLEMYSNFLAKI